MKDQDVRALIEALGGDHTQRQAAVARLTILGKRAVGRLVDAFQTTGDRRVQMAILQVFEASSDERVIPVLKRALDAGGDLAVGGIAVLRELLGRPQGSADVKALDMLLQVAADPSSEHRVRSAAVQALESAPPDVRHAVGALAVSESSEAALWQDAIAGQLPDDPVALRDAVGAHAPVAPLADLRRLIEAVRLRQEGDARAAQDWLAVRGAIHQALALRNSRIALYDLRETFERSTRPLPSSFVGAVQTIGDQSCLEPLALAFARGGADPHWQHQIARAFQEIVKRQRITKRHSALRRALAKAPELER